VGEATARVKDTLDRAMDINTDPALIGSEHRLERAKAIRELIDERFLTEDMAKRSLEGHWEKLPPEKRKEFLELFTILFLDSYTRMVLNFLDKETVEYNKELPRGENVWVQTVIMRANDHIPVDYYLVARDGKWFIRDVDIDGVSIVRNYKNAFRRVVKRHSFDVLLEKMRLQRRAVEEKPS
jgi:phospholipid transport system substrate-binding protein